MRRVSVPLQELIEEARSRYAKLGRPLLQQLAELHGLSIRKFAEIFGISNGYAENVLKHKVFPTLELAVRIARYFDCGVDELFAWRVDDTGDRCSRLVELPGGRTIKIHSQHPNSLPIIEQLIGGEKC